MRVDRNVVGVLFTAMLGSGAFGCVTPRESLPDAATGGAGGGQGGGGANGGGLAGQAPSNDAADASPDAVNAGDTLDVSVAPDTAQSDADATADRAGSTDATDAPMTAPDASAGLKDNGAACGVHGECKSDSCVESVCCDGACSGKCSSCLTAYTGKPTGQCASVMMGFAHGTDCTASAPSTCGLDGTCDGAGACRNHVNGTSCRAESCSDAAALSNYTSARTCDGHGVCTPPTTSMCGSAYRCSGTKCRTNCTGAQDCVPADYCAGTTCVAKKADGQPCASATECAKGVCGGLCCAAGCTCTQPSPDNLLNNPGIDQDTNGWTIDSGTLVRSLSDREQCPYSGSLTTTIQAGGAVRMIRQCVHNRPLSGLFNFGAQIQTVGGAAAQVICQVTFYSGFNCDADTITTNETQALTHAGWEAPVPESALVDVTGANSVSLGCALIADPSTSTDYYLDMLYVSKLPTEF